MPIVTTRKATAPGAPWAEYQVTGTGNAHLTPHAIAREAQDILAGLGPGFELQINLLLPGLGWKTPGGGFIRDGAIIDSLVLDPASYDMVAYADGSAGEHPLGTITEAHFVVRHIRGFRR